MSMANGGLPDLDELRRDVARAEKEKDMIVRGMRATLQNPSRRTMLPVNLLTLAVEEGGAGDVFLWIAVPGGERIEVVLGAAGERALLSELTRRAGERKETATAIVDDMTKAAGDGSAAGA
jgi:hypothetical protein